MSPPDGCASDYDCYLPILGSDVIVKFPRDYDARIKGHSVIIFQVVLES